MQAPEQMCGEAERARAVPARSQRLGLHALARAPEPVVLVHGLGATMVDNWSYLSPLLADEGYCVFALTYGRHPLAPPPLRDQVGGLVRMEESAAELGAFLDRVLDATGADRVDLVGHSQGSLMPTWYVRFLGGSVNVDDYVGLTPLWDGTQLAGIHLLRAASRAFGLTPVEEALFAATCASCRQFPTGSDFLAGINFGDGPAVPEPTYTMILTRYDELVIPYTRGLMDTENATNIVVQDVCPTDLSEHGAVAYDPVVGRLVLNALDPESAQPVSCIGA